MNAPWISRLSRTTLEPLYCVISFQRQEFAMTKKQLFVERREQGDYAVRRGGSERASAVEPTQKAAIERARQLHPGHDPLVERVRNTSQGKPDKWRNP
jgi:hypothetical protein